MVSRFLQDQWKSGNNQMLTIRPISTWWQARHLKTLLQALRVLNFVAAGLGPLLVHNARFWFNFVVTGVTGAAIGHFLGKAEHAPGPQSILRWVRKQLIVLGMCAILYVIVGVALEDWIPVLFVRSPDIYASGTFIRYAAWARAVVWGACFLILTRLMTLLVRAASREQER